MNVLRVLAVWMALTAALPALIAGLALEVAPVRINLLAAGFVETAFHCPSCGLGGTSLSRPSSLIDRTCLDCGEPVVTSVLDRFAR